MESASGGLDSSILKRIEDFEAELTSAETRDSALGRLREEEALQDALTAVHRLPTTEVGRCAIDFSACELLSVTEHSGLVVAAQTRPEHLWGPTQTLVVKLLWVSRLEDEAAVGALAAESAATRVGQPQRYLFSAHGVLVTAMVPGVPLAEWVERQPWWRIEGRRRGAYVLERVEAMRTIGTELCRALDELGHSQLGGHGNLDLGSILIDEEGGLLSVALIDLAPEADEYHGPSEPSRNYVTLDAEGIGMAMLQVATPYAVKRESGSEEDAVQKALAELWGDAPGFARIVEDLVDPHPDNRLAMVGKGIGDTSQWEELETQIQYEYELQRMFRAPTDGSGGGEVSVTNWEQVRRYFDATKHLKTGALGSGWQSSSLLRGLNVAAYAFWVLALTGFVLLTSADLGLDAPVGTTAHFIETHTQFRVGEFAANFPGRLIAITFAYIVLNFYVRILSGVTVRRLGSPWIELALRSAPVVMNLPVLVVIFYDPQLWAIGATAGLVGAVLVCLAMRELDRRALRRMEKPFEYSKAALREARRARRPHWSWWTSLGVYLLVVLVPLDFGLYSAAIGITDHPILRDGGFYALLIAVGCNAYSIYWNSVHKLERNTRGCLEQSSFIIRRAAQLRDSPTPPSIYDESRVRGAVLTFLPAIPVFAGAVYLAASWDRGSTRWVLLGIGALAVAATIGLIVAARTGRARLSLTARRALLAVPTAFGTFAFLALPATALDGIARLGGLLLAAVAATAIGDLVFKTTSFRLRRAARASDESPEYNPSAEIVEAAFTEAEAGLRRKTPAREVSAGLGRRLLNVTPEARADQIEKNLIDTWKTAPYVGRLAELLLIRNRGHRLVVGTEAELRTMEVVIERGEAERDGLPRHFLPARRAEVCLASAEELTPRTLATLRAIGFASVAIAAVCIAGYLFYAVTDLDWDRTAGRTIALSYSIAAVYYYRTLVGWITLAGMRRTPTELALRSVPFVFQGPAFTAIFLWPEYWPLEATIGVAATAVVNLLLLRLIEASGRHLAASGGWTEREASSLTENDFASWWTTAVIYLSGMIFFDVLLTATHVLHDAALYALVIAAGANTYLIVHSSLQRHGPEVRGQLTRAVLVLRVLAPIPERRSIQFEAPLGLLALQALLVGVAAVGLGFAHLGSGTAELDAMGACLAAVLTFLGAAGLQRIEASPEAPRAEALSRLMASLACWGAGAALFAIGSMAGSALAAFLALLAAITVALWRADSLGFGS